MTSVIRKQELFAPSRDWRPILLDGGSGTRAFALGARAPHLHDLVGDSSQPGMLGGCGVKAVALTDIKAGEVVFRDQGEVFSQPSMHSIQIGIERHCEIRSEGRFIAHGYSPNMAVFVSPHEQDPWPIKWVALRPIPKGEELSWDYNTTEWELKEGGFVDGASRRPVRGFKHLEETEKRRLLEAGLVNTHILRLWLGDVLEE